MKKPMKTKTITFVFLIVCLMTVTASAQRRIEFKRGTSSTTIHGTAGVDDNFQFRAREGQTVTISVTPARLFRMWLSYDGDCGDSPCPVIENRSSGTARLKGDGVYFLGAMRVGKRQFGAFTITISIK